jgi:two-component system response regulator MprA
MTSVDALIRSIDQELLAEVDRQKFTWAAGAKANRQRELQTRSFLMNQALLIADGDAELCDVYRGFFACQGFDVKTALDGLDCVEKLRRVTPAVLVLALELRWGGGDGVLAWLREEGAKSGVPVILTIAAGSPPHMAAFTEPPVVDHLCKPFALTALLERVRSAGARTGALTRNPPDNT